MPRLIEVGDQPPCDLDACLAALNEHGVDPQEEGSLHHAARWLKRLGANRSFLSNLLLAELRDRHREDDGASVYGPQVITLSKPQGNFFMRANIWPAEEDHTYRASGGASFVYGLPHDHNFSFLTQGYFGPGYWSDYYEYDFEAVDGWTGEPANLRFTGRRRLEEGSVMLYRAHLDVHSQLPPDAMSCSLNIMHMGDGQGWLDQYRFDTDAGTVDGVVNPASSEVFLRMAVGLGDAEALDLAERFALSHPSDRMRLACWDARAATLPGLVERDALWREAERSGSRMVAMEARARRAALTA